MCLNSFLKWFKVIYTLSKVWIHIHMEKISCNTGKKVRRGQSPKNIKYHCAPHTTIYKIIANKNLLYSTGNSTQYSDLYGNIIWNRFKGLDLIGKVPEELWTEAPDIVQETGIKTILKKKKCKKAKWLSEEALQIAVKREVKSKGEREWYTHLNAEFQRITRRDKKVDLSDQCTQVRKQQLELDMEQ